MTRHFEVEWDPAGLQKIQEDADRELRRVIWDVRNRMVGQPSGLVYDELVRLLRESLGTGFTPDESVLWQFAAAIEADDLTK